MDADEQTRRDAAKWRAMDSAVRARVALYEHRRIAWATAKTSGEAVQAREEMDKAARDVAGYLSLVLGVTP